MSEPEPLEDPPRVRIENGMFIVEAMDGSYYYQRVSWPMRGIKADPIPTARRVQHAGQDAPVFQLILPGPEVRVPGGRYVGKEEIVFEAPDPDDQLIRAYQEAIG